MFAWEQRKLGEVGKTQSGVGFPNKEQGGHQGIPFFKVSDMNNEGNEFEMKISNNYVTEIQITNRKWKPISGVPAVIFAKVGAALMLNRKRLVKVPFLIDNNAMAYIFNKKWDPYFGKILFDTLNLPRYAQIGALPSFNGSDIENIKVMLPSLEEQQTLSQFFQNINSLIALHQRKPKCTFKLPNLT
ncbi:restriction endonuclease subunit S [Ligilactobacillus salivarius]|uniref:restriction endonuclease subunit S n=1 Tax=Ligilactobacillus salivarius TaxID=1624 RepID=UPI0021DA985A|nr:restriction endonuclease subunit S [Ligilactobacillus salivarius]